MNAEELRSIQWLLPELADGVFEQADFRHFQQIFRGSVSASTILTQNQLWSIQQMFPTDGLDLDDLLHYQLLFRVDMGAAPVVVTGYLTGTLEIKPALSGNPNI